MIDLIPCQNLIRGNIYGFSDSLGIADQTGQGTGKITMIRDGPKGGAIPRNNGWLFFQNPSDHGPTSFSTGNAKRKPGFVVGVTGADNGHWKIAGSVKCLQFFFAGEFVLCIIPIRIIYRCTFRDLIAGKGTAIYTGRTDENKLPGAVLKIFIVSSDFGRQLNGKINHTIKEESPDQFLYVLLIVNITDKRNDSLMERTAVQTAIQHIKGVVLCCKQLCNC